MVMLFPLSRIWSSFVILRPSGVLSNTVTSSKTMSENKSRMNSKLFSQNKTNDRPQTEGSKDKSPEGYTLVIGYWESAVGWGHIFVTN